MSLRQLALLRETFLGSEVGGPWPGPSILGCPGLSLFPGKSRGGEPGQAAELALATRTLVSLFFLIFHLFPSSSPEPSFSSHSYQPSSLLFRAHRPAPYSSNPPNLARRDSPSVPSPLLHCDLLHLPVKWGEGGWLTTPQKTGFNISQVSTFFRRPCHALSDQGLQARPAVAE